MNKLASASAWTVLCAMALVGTEGQTSPPEHAKAQASKSRPPAYSLTEIDVPPRDLSECDFDYMANVVPRGMNETLRVVGLSECYVSTDNPDAPVRGRGYRAFAWSPNSGTYDLPLLNSDVSQAIPYGINADGDAVGFENILNGLASTYWPVSGGVRSAIDSWNCRSPMPYSQARGINDANDVLGVAYRYMPDGSCDRAWVIQPGTGEELVIQVPLGSAAYDISNNRHVAGMIEDSAVLWSPGEGMKTLHSAASNHDAYALEVNNNGDAIGFVRDYDPTTGCEIARTAHLWHADGTEEALPTFVDSPLTSASGINDRNWVVGYAESGECVTGWKSVIRAMLWIDGVAYDLNEVIPRKSRVHLIQAGTVTNSGAILAVGIKLDEPLKPCPTYIFDPNTGQQVYDPSPMCPSQYAFLLVPKGKT